MELSWDQRPRPSLLEHLKVVSLGVWGEGSLRCRVAPGSAGGMAGLNPGARHPDSDTAKPVSNCGCADLAYTESEPRSGPGTLGLRGGSQNGGQTKVPS